MKSLLLFLPFFILSFQTSDFETYQSDPIQISNSLDQNPELDACTCFNKSQLAKALSWDIGKMEIEDGENTEFESNCYISYNSDKLLVQLKKANDRNKDKSTLSSKYSNLLSQSSAEMTYKEYSNSGDEQIILGETRSGATIENNILKKRIGDKYEINLQLTLKNKQEDNNQALLVDLLQSLEQ